MDWEEKNYFSIAFKIRKISKTTKNDKPITPKIIEENENIILYVSLEEIEYNIKDIIDKIPNKIKFFKTRLIFFLVERTNLLETTTLLLFLFLTLFFFAIFNILSRYI